MAMNRAAPFFSCLCELLYTCILYIGVSQPLCCDLRHSSPFLVFIFCICYFWFTIHYFNFLYTIHSTSLLNPYYLYFEVG